MKVMKDLKVLQPGKFNANQFNASMLCLILVQDLTKQLSLWILQKVTSL